MTGQENISENGIIEMTRRCARLLDGRKGDDILIIDLKRVNSYLDYFLITTGNSRVHCRAMARELEKFMHENGWRVRNRPDHESGWIILDFGELIVHIFTQELREYYQLDKLWGDAEVIPY
ncbi:MAG: ribosome silencing factor [Spirochaetes bacterium]|nr:ribosome silencing factor [Spirochaetota bacterium]